MYELHPTHCACHDCRNRRLIRDAGQASERNSADELEDFGYFGKGKPPVKRPVTGPTPPLSPGFRSY
jgi:hypothetical protein